MAGLIGDVFAMGRSAQKAHAEQQARGFAGIKAIRRVTNGFMALAHKNKMTEEKEVREYLKQQKIDREAQVRLRMKEMQRRQGVDEDYAPPEEQEEEQEEEEQQEGGYY